MKLGIFSWYGFKAPFEYRLTKIRQFGFDSTMFWGSDQTEDDYPYGVTALTKVADLHLEIENVHLPFDRANDVWVDDGITRQDYIQEHLKHIWQCQKCTIPMVVMHACLGLDVAKPTINGIDAFQIIVEEAEKAGVTIAVENTRRINLIEAVLDNIKSDYLGLCYDTSHGRLYEPAEFHLLKKYSQRLKCLHISDNDGIEDRHWTIGKGLINWKGFVECFPDNYDGALSLEVYPADDCESEESHLREALRGLTELRDKIMYRQNKSANM